MKHAKRIMVAALAATLACASSLTVCAAGGSGGSGGVVTETSGGGSHSSHKSTSSHGSVAAADLKSPGAAVTVAGSSTKTTIAGAYAAKGVRGAAVVTNLAAIRESLGLKSSQNPYVIVLDTDPEKSYRAMNSIREAATALGAQVVTALNVDLGANKDGKFTTLSDGSISMMVGLPETADLSKDYSVILVQPGGKITVLKDQDQDPKTLTFAVQAGLGTYAVVAD